MARFTKRQYRNQLLAVMTVYVILMLAEWPHVRDPVGLPIKVVLALLPVLPMIVVLWLIAKRVLSSDELEQRLYLSALGIAAAAVCTLSLIGGFLAASHVIELGGEVLIWVFPLLSVCFGAAHAWLGRRYGYGACE
jgi:hypothetical protein